jgi:hypothetical protein
MDGPGVTMRIYATLSLFLMVSSVLLGQEHAPTTAQCQADDKWWSAESRQATEGTGFDLTIRDYSLNDLIARSKELMSCMAVDPHGGGYATTAMLILSQVNKRLVRYVQETGQADRYDAWEKQQQAHKSQ